VSANLDLVRSICELWDRGDYSSVDWQHPAVEFVIADGPTPGSWTGAAGITQGWGEFLRAWDGFHHTADEYVELDEHRVLVLVRFGGRGKTSGLSVDQLSPRGALLFVVRDAAVTRIVLYFDRERAFRELGIPGGTE
jgi:ketosteroid isomerase-like protein